MWTKNGDTAITCKKCFVVVCLLLYAVTTHIVTNILLSQCKVKFLFADDTHNWLTKITCGTVKQTKTFEYLERASITQYYIKVCLRSGKPIQALDSY